jgi:hypothetical protein
MSDTLQSGRLRDAMQHPDADQLSAFAENVLPAHERQETLTHLSVCPDCRAVVAHLLPQNVGSPEPAIVTARKPWFSGWHLAWPVAVALAGIALFFYIRPSGTARNGTVDSTQASNRPSNQPISQPQDQIGSARPLPPVASRKASPPAHDSEPQSPRQPASAVNLPQPAPAAPVQEAKKADSTIVRQDAAQLPLQGRNPASIAELQQRAASVSGSAAGISPGAGVADAKNRDAAIQSSPPQFTAAPAPASPARAQTEAKADASSQTVEVNRQAPIATTPPTITAEIPAENSVALNQTKVTQAQTDRAQVASLSSPQHALPSRLAVVSTVTHERQILAIDTNGAVFYSKDDGKHWKAISPKWQGRAIKVDLAGSLAGSQSSPNIRREENEPSALSSISSFKATAGASHGPERDAGPGLAGTITDVVGAVIPGATIVATNTAAHLSSRTTTDSRGAFVIAGLMPGSYDVEMRSPGFVTRSLHNIAVSASQTSIGSVALSIGSVSETVTVQAEAPPLEAHGTARKTLAKARAPLPVFEITTDTGEHWTSSDGVTWTHP